MLRAADRDLVLGGRDRRERRDEQGHERECPECPVRNLTADPTAAAIGRCNREPRADRRDSGVADDSPAGPATWILTGSLENFRINAERGFDVIGFKERRRNQALEIEPGDEIVFYVTGVQAFGGIARVTPQMFEDRDADLAPGQEEACPSPIRGASRRSRLRPRRGRVRPRRGAGDRARARRASGPPTTGTSPSRASCAPSPRPTRGSCARARGRRRGRPAPRCPRPA